MNLTEKEWKTVETILLMKSSETRRQPCGGAQWKNKVIEIRISTEPLCPAIGDTGTMRALPEVVDFGSLRSIFRKSQFSLVNEEDSPVEKPLFFWFSPRFHTILRFAR
jgi:hypothetical protein